MRINLQIKDPIVVQFLQMFNKFERALIIKQWLADGVKSDKRFAPTAVRGKPPLQAIMTACNTDGPILNVYQGEHGTQTAKKESIETVVLDDIYGDFS